MYSVFVSEGLSNARRQTIAAVTVAATAFCLFSLNSFFLPFYKKCARPHPFSFGTATKRPTDRPNDDHTNKRRQGLLRRAKDEHFKWVHFSLKSPLFSDCCFCCCYVTRRNLLGFLNHRVFVLYYRNVGLSMYEWIMPSCAGALKASLPKKNQIESSSQKIKKNVIKKAEKWRRRALLPFCAVMTKIVVNIVAVFCFTLFLL